jgi:NAD(P)-dependent dehydrogenase (short-subunit alcohol dehydrogenase family)
MKRVLITGVSSGTGLGLTEKFVSEGYQVIGSVRTPEKAAELHSRYGESFVPLIFDITKPNQVAAASEKLRNQFGVKYLSAIINNAGTAKIGPLLHVPIDELTEHLDILVVGQLSVIQNFYKFLIPDDADHEVGRIVNITSVSGVEANNLFGCYASGKHALEGLSKTLRQECLIYGIKVLTVAPGNIATAIWDKQTEEITEKYRDTDYYDFLKDKIQYISSNIVKESMSAEEFSNAFFSVFNDVNPADRYTIIKSRNNKLPFGQSKTRILRS